jgi:DnaJ-class molecular chaperone
MRQFKAIQHARSILKDTDKRSTYDRFNFDGKGRCLGLSDEAIEKAARVQQKFEGKR